MDSILQRSYKTNFDNHTLWYDGSISVNSLNTLMDYIQKGISVDNLYVNRITSEIERYNKLVSKQEKITEKVICDELDVSWNIPENSLLKSLQTYVISKLEHLANQEQYTDEEITIRVKRILHELRLFEKNKLNNVLQAIIYIINTLEENNVVWGVGRGSSVASYVLYLIGAHDIDSIKYELNIEDFIT